MRKIIILYNLATEKYEKESLGRGLLKKILKGLLLSRYMWGRFIINQLIRL